MSQSSLLTWLNKPGSVESAPPREKPEPELPSTPGRPVADHLSSSPNADHGKTRTDQVFPNQQPAPLPPNVEFRSCTKEDIPHLKRLTSLLLPIPYPDKFYRDIIDDPVTNSITLLAFWHDDPPPHPSAKGRLIGAVRCRLLDASTISGSVNNATSNAPLLYLSTLVLLSPYRQHGIATHMLRAMMKKAANDHGTVRVGAHVWEANSDALAWYHKRGFREIKREPGYYRRLQPQDAIVVERDIGVMDLLSA
ncbi:putative GNAT domain, acyl-CoA N-acyltransferase [Septoria linicola]|nr:putative GNAT domain, acyl-CoA N-acyltransferase [Septoria linicola]